MNSHTTDEFRASFARLPKRVQELARRYYRKWVNNPRLPSLQYKRVHPTDPIFSIRVGKHHRALCMVDGNDVYWFWIGSHAEYDTIIRSY